VVASGGIGGELAELLQSLEGQTLKPIEVVVVTPSEGPAEELVKSCSLNLRFIHLEKDPGPMLSRIFGALASAGELVAFIDSDCKAPPSWLEEMTREIETPGVSLVAGSVVGINREKLISRLQDDSLIASNPRYSGRRIIRGDMPPILVVTANMLLDRSILYSDGVIPPSYGRYGFEDIDFVTRVLRSGHSILLTPSLVYHRNRTSLRRLVRRFYEYGAGLPLYRRSCPRAPYGRVVAALLYSTLLTAASSLILAVAGLGAPGLAVGITPLVVMYAYHLLRARPFKPEVLLYPPAEYLLALSAAVGALSMEARILLGRGVPTGER